MKRVVASPSKGMIILYRSVIALLLMLVVVVVSGSLYAIIRPRDSGPLFTIGSGGVGAGNAGEGSGFNDGAVGIFTEIGRLRIPVGGQAAVQEPAAQEADQGPSGVVLSISFPYPADDRAFSEELDSRTGDFRSLAFEYFSSLSGEQVARLDEKTAKDEILKRYNALLRLGKIETLFFGDFYSY
jgi:hypothetical protein